MTEHHRLPLFWVLLSLAACGDAAAELSAPNAGGVTWYGDVAHVALGKCMGCHNDDAPTFSMARYDDALRARAGLIAAYTQDGTMPPWKPRADCNSYADERRLTDDEKALFQAWADGGALEGDPAAGPAPPEGPAGLARVDRRLEMPEAYVPRPPEGDVNDHRCFVLDPALTGSEQLVGFDIRPGERAVVHHVLLYMADAAEAEALDAAAPGQGYACPGGPGANSAAVIAGWVPGMPANLYPPGTGIPLAGDSAIVMQIHYNTLHAGALPDRTAVELMFADTPMDHEAQIVPLRDGSFEIPPMTEGYQTRVSVAVPAKATVWAVAPHMHLKGRRALIEVERASGEDTCLLDIPDWDFNWQQFYFFADPRGIRLMPGDRVTFSCTWDNTTSHTVRWGDGTEDEMCIAYAYVTAGHVD